MNHSAILPCKAGWMKPRDARNVIPFGRSRGTVRRSARYRPRRLWWLPRRAMGFLVFLTMITAASLWPRVEPFIPFLGTGDAVLTERYVRTFGECETASRKACVVDGDTFWLDGVKVRMTDIDTPELSPPRCDYERQLGLKAKARLRELLSAGPFSLERGSRDEDRYGRKLRVVRADNGASIGGILVSEGVARHWEGARRPWCS